MIYVIYDKPVQAMKKEVWQDFLEIACTAAEGEKEPKTIKNKVLLATWEWMHANISYYNVTNISRETGNTTFKFSEMRSDGEGCCTDSAALFQICCNAVGIDGVKLKGVDNTDPLQEFVMSQIKIFSDGDEYANKWSFARHMLAISPGKAQNGAPENETIYEALAKKAIIVNGIFQGYYKVEGLNYTDYINRFFVTPLPPHRWKKMANVKKVK